MPITARQLRAAKWREIYRYDGHTLTFVTFACGIPQLTLTHETRKGSKKMVTSYSAFGQRTDSPTHLVRLYNAEEKAAATISGGRKPAGSPQSIAARKDKMRGRGDERP